MDASSDQPTRFDISGMLSTFAVTLRSNRTVAEISADMSDPNFISKVKRIFKENMQTLRPWNEFGNSSYFSKPETFGQALSRTSFNVRYFATNYLIIFLGLFVYCLITSPLLLFAVGFVMIGSAGIMHFNGKPPIVIAGREFNSRSQKIAVCVITVPLFWMAAAGSVVFWLLGCSAVIILAHSSCLNNEMIANSEEWAREIDAIA
eukprot:CFRG6433T1